MKDLSFVACLKKEFKETTRNNRFLMFLLIAVGMAVFALGTLVMMWFMLEIIKVSGMDMPEEMKLMMKMFEMTYPISLSYFTSFMSQFMAIIILIMLCNIIGKEIKEKKWVLPMQAGIKSSTIILSRLMVVTGTVMVAVLASCIFHFLATLILCKPVTDVSVLTQIGHMWYSYLMLMIWILFFTVLTCTISAIAKKGWVAIVIGLVVLLVLPLAFAAIPVGGGEYLVNYTPIKFMNEITRFDGLTSVMVPGLPAAPMPTIWMWLSSSLSTVGIMAGMIIWSVSANKIKSEKN